jgi:glyoxylase-like metal-dependent hydrolase (beta-lactamase superfamily II)
MAFFIGLTGVMLCALGVWAFARPRRWASSGDLQLHRLAADVYLYRGFFSNSAVLVLDSAVVVVDTQVSPLAAQRLKDAIAKVTPLPVKYVVNTHYHGDHTGGNAAFPEAEVISTDDCGRYIVERDSERVEYAQTFGLAFAQVHPTRGPTRTFKGSLQLSVGRDVLELHQWGAVETPDACVVVWPARKVVACGDAVSTRDYPYLGVPFLDEGLRDDGQWLGCLTQIRDQQPELLLAGHGPALVGRRRIGARLNLLLQLKRDLLNETRRELAAGGSVAQIVERVDARLAHYRRRGDLFERTVSQRFAIYRCINNLSPERKGRGWWHELRPSVIRRAGPAELVQHDALTRTGDEVIALARRSRRALAIALLERWLEGHPDDARAHASLAVIFLEGFGATRPSVDGTEFVVAAGRAARAAAELDPHEPLALLVLGAVEVFGAMVLAQPMASGIAKLETALASPLSVSDQRLGQFFLGKAHQLELRPEDSDRHYRRLLPAWARPLYPLIRERLRAYP